MKRSRRRGVPRPIAPAVVSDPGRGAGLAFAMPLLYWLPGLAICEHEMTDTDRPAEAGRVLLFDLGGVIVDFVGVEALDALTGGRYGADEIRRRWPLSPTLRAFETGRLTPEAFADRFIADWELDLPRDAFLAQFPAWTRAPYDGAVELLQALRRDHMLACLSNINAIHWERCGRFMGLQALFDHCFASHLIGLHKPDPALFDHVAATLGRPPAEILFFDDTPVNVEAALERGFDAHRVCGLDELRATLARLGITTDTADDASRDSPL